MNKKSLNFFKIVLYSFLVFNAVSVLAASGGLPPGKAITTDEITGLITTIAHFLMITSVIIAIIAFILSGLIYMTAGANPKKVEQAQTMFKNAVIGTLIVLGVGVIINTLAGVVTRDFFCEVRVPIVGICLY